MGVISRLDTTPVKKHPPPLSIKRARELRTNATEAEKAMSRLLKQCFPEARFRFQVPLRHYIADFASHRLRIVVEIDGGQHSPKADRQRTAAIEAEGYRVIRFWNSEVLENPDGCAILLEQFLRRQHPHPATTSEQARKSPHPSPIEGEEG
jgi:very-short-patch-repair endonuclease